MGMEAHAPDLGLAVEDSLRGVLALGLLAAESVRMEPVPREFDEDCAQVDRKSVV